MHPLINDLSSFRDTELETKISQLTNHYYSSSNPQVKQQLIMLIDSYRDELSSRRTKELERSMANKNKDIDKLINIS